MAERVKRKISAILSADAVGYSRLMSEDEIGTVNRLKAYRKLIGVSVGEHHGRVVDNPGDNILAEFPSALDATCCAVEIQGMLENRNADLPDDRRMDFRIGIHLSDVMVDGDRIYGDGVNIAARMEESSETGGICVSSAVHEQVKNKLDLDFEDLGEKEVKNLPDPVHAYQALLGYVAFISYSHTDAKWANWLQKSLESYRVPMELVKSDSSLIHSKRLVPVFRGPEEPSSGLSETIEGAISNSDAMIVICSPSAAQSRFVNEEILTFKRLGMGKKLLPLIVGGEPRSEEDECFPPSLKYKLDDNGNLSDELDEEPIGADVRPGKDSRSTAKLKIIAGLIGVGLDDLRQREARKRLKQMSGIAASSFLVMVLMIALAISAYLSKREAQRSRAQAEDLIGYMLGDLRKKLETIGRLDILDDVGDKAMGYFSSVEATKLSRTTLVDRARAVRQVGQVRLDQGRLAEALESFEHALTMDRQLLSQNPNDQNVIFGIAQSEFWLASVARMQGDLLLTKERMLRYSDYAQQLVGIDPRNPRWLKEASYALTNLGVVCLERKQMADARDFLSQGIERIRALVEMEPTGANKYDLVQNLSWLARANRHSGHLTEALTLYRDLIGSLRELVTADEGNFNYKSTLANHLSIAGTCLLDLGDTNSALNHYTQSMEIFDELSERDPTNLAWRRNRTVTESNMSRAKGYLGESAIARAGLQKAVRVATELVSGEPANRDSRSMLLGAAIPLSRLHIRVGDLHQARAVIESVSDSDAVLSESDDISHLGLVIQYRALRAELAKASGKDDLTRELLRKSGSILLSQSTEEFDLRIAVARFFLATGQEKYDTARSIAGELMELGYAEPYFSELVRKHSL